MTADPTTTIDTERQSLLDCLTTRRNYLIRTVDGLDDRQVALRPTASELCLGGIIKHVARAESGWLDFILDGPSAIGDADEASYAAHLASFRMEAGDTLAGVLARYRAVADRADELVAALPSLDVSHPLPVAPWFEPGGRRSARDVLLHIIAETAQHAGHADIIRESIDGAKTMG
jgi:hypothetical protein